MIRKESLTVSRETFAAERRAVLADAEEALRPHVREALARIGLGSWEQQIVAAALDIFDLTAGAQIEEGSQSMDDLRDLFAKELGEALEKTRRASDAEAQTDSVTRWVAMMSHNAAMEAATSSDPDGNVGLEWVTMSDGKVRESHADANGQQVPTGSPFTVDGVELMYPGQPVGDPSVWLNCRCVARPTMLGELASQTVTAANVSRETFAGAPGLKKDGTPPACKFCTEPSTGYVLHSEGMAYIPFCAAHQSDAEAAAAESVPGGEPDPGNIDRVAEYSTVSRETFADVSRETETEEEPMEDPKNTSSVIVALPTASDPVNALGPEQSHVTLVWLGDADGFDSGLMIDELAAYAGSFSGEPLTDRVSGTALLGQDKADVLLLDATHLNNIRNGLLMSGLIKERMDAVEQHPTWIPHLTLGYASDPDYVPMTNHPEAITFDRIALWHGNEQTEFMLGSGEPAYMDIEADKNGGNNPLDSSYALSDEEALKALGSLVASAGIDDVSRETDDAEDEDETDWDEEFKSLNGAEEFAEVPWYGVLTVEGVETGDGRKFALDSLTNRPLPLPLKFMWEDDEGHKGSYPVARIDRIWRDGNLIKGEGVFDTSEQAYETVRLLANGIMRGVSVDLDSASLVQGDDSDVMEFATGRISSATICAIPAFAEAFVAIGTWADAGDVSRETEEGVEPPTPPAGAKPVEPSPEDAVASDVSRETFDVVPPKTMDGPGWITDPKPTHKITSYWVDGRGAAKIGWGAPGDFNRCRAQLGKYVQNPAWLAGLCANLHYRALGVWPGQASGATTEMNQPIGPAASLVASAAPDVISADFFRNPNLTGPTPVTRGEDGYIFGHLAEWGTCHIGFEVCTTVPPSATNYAYFLTGQVFTDVGPVAVGQLTVGGGHAGGKLGVRAAIAHYDNVGTAVADITVGEDAFGVWFAGRIRPWATEKQIHELFAAGPSGDWRPVRSRGRESKELVAAHAVNVQGFPVPRTSFAIEDGRQLSLITGGIPNRDQAAEASALLAEIRAMEFSMLTETITTLEGK